MDVTPRELRDTDIREGFRGYHRDDVDELLERAAATIESMQDRVRQLTERLAQAESRPAGESVSETEDILKRTLVLAQKAADEAVAEAQTRARQMLEESEAKSRRIVDEAENTARRIHESERARLEAEVTDLGNRRAALNADVDALEKFEREYHTRLRDAVEAELSSLGNLSLDMGPRPDQHDVVVPRPTSAVDSGARGSGTASAQGSAVEAFLAASNPPAPTRPAPSRSEPSRSEPPRSEPPRSEPPRSEPPRSQAARTEAPPAEPQPDARSEVRPEPRPASRAAARETSSAAASNARGSELSNYVADDGDDPAELDDDAFFATLREAVRDEAPLGPNEEDFDDGGFFDQDREEEPSRRRFRRRR